MGYSLNHGSKSKLGEVGVALDPTENGRKSLQCSRDVKSHDNLYVL
jgi:hypothetical protein